MYRWNARGGMDVHARASDDALDRAAREDGGARARFAARYGERALQCCLARCARQGMSPQDCEAGDDAESFRRILEGAGPADLFETERLALREMTSGDLPALRAILQDPVTMTAYEHAFSEAEVEEWLVKQQIRYAVDGFGLWAVVDKRSGEMIGQCGLTMQDAGGRQVVEVGYLFRRDCWHHGYATEAARACKHYAFEVLEVDEVYSIIRDSNLASQAVARRNGMAPCGVIVKHYWGVDMPHILFVASRA